MKRIREKAEDVGNWLGENTEKTMEIAYFVNLVVGRLEHPLLRLGILAQALLSEYKVTKEKTEKEKKTFLRGAPN